MEQYIFAGPRPRAAFLSTGVTVFHYTDGPLAGK